jgi:DNA-binding response OmpR family regulator
MFLRRATKPSAWLIISFIVTGISAMMEPLFILLVETEYTVREALDLALSEAGFRVIFASDASEATAELSLNPALYKAVITDVRTGNGPGSWDVAHRARELVQGIPIIYINGEGTHDWLIKGVPKSVLVITPFVPAQVVAAVLTLMNTNIPKPSSSQTPRSSSGSADVGPVIK